MVSLNYQFKAEKGLARNGLGGVIVGFFFALGKIDAPSFELRFVRPCGAHIIRERETSPYHHCSLVFLQRAHPLARFVADLGSF